MFSVDGLTWPYRCAIERAARLQPSDISGLMMDGSYFNDLHGTYMSYTIMIAVPLTDRDSITPLYEALTDPVDGHVFVFPYNQSTITVTGRVDGEVGDVYVDLPNGQQYWKGLQFTIIANHPSKQYTLSEVLTRGRAPLPDIAMPEVGDTYTYTASGWEKVTS